MTRVLDGDTIEVEIRRTIRIRLLDCWAPETRTRDLEKILRHYKPVKASRLVLTKLDETECHGPLLSLPIVSKLPLSYLTSGQEVPDDIESADPRRLARLILGMPGDGVKE